MRTRIFLLTMPALLGCAIASAPLAASADQQRGYERNQRQEHRVEHRNRRQTKTIPSQHVDRNASRHLERQRPTPQRPAAIQRETHDRYRITPSRQGRHVETHRSIRIQPPHVTAYRRSWSPVPRMRYYHGVRVYRPYGHRYPGFGFFYDDDDAFRWLAFTALSMVIIDHLDEHQQRLYEQAFIQATSAYVGDTIYWQDGRSYGSITVLDIWHDDRGRQCRRLEQTVTTGGFSETRLNTACMQPNGVWVVSDGR